MIVWSLTAVVQSFSSSRKLDLDRAPRSPVAENDVEDAKHHGAQISSISSILNISVFSALEVFDMVTYVVSLHKVDVKKPQQNRL